MTKPIETSEDKANMYHYLAGFYNHKPDIDMARKLKSIDGNALQDMTEVFHQGSRAADGIEYISNYIRAIQNLSVDEIEEELAVDWTRLFRGVKPDYGPKPPYESVYMTQGKEDQSQMADILSSLMSTYRRENVVINQGKSNRPDYIGLELGFLGFLSEKEEEARERGEVKEAEAYAVRAQKFLKQHPGRWIANFCEEAEKYAETDFYRGVMSITKGVVEEFLSTGIKEAEN